MPVSHFDDLDLDRQYTYADYLTWTFAERVELLRGWVARMSPAPNLAHQAIAVELTGTLYAYFRDHPCRLFAAPFDVRLPRTHGGETVVQPDLCVVCDGAKLTTQGCTGAPDWVIEILDSTAGPRPQAAPPHCLVSNSRRELRDKFALYEEAGVREYWLVHPLDRAIQRFVLEAGRYVGLAPATDEDDAIGVSLFEGLTVDGRRLFARV